MSHMWPASLSPRPACPLARHLQHRRINSRYIPKCISSPLAIPSLIHDGDHSCPSSAVFDIAQNHAARLMIREQPEPRLGLH